MKKIIFLLLLVGLVVANEPSFDGDDEEDFIESLVKQPEDKDEQAKQLDADLNLKSEDPVDFSIFSKFIHYLLNVSIAKVKPDEHPDRKYIRPGEKLIRRLLVVRRAVIGALGPIVEIGKLIARDHRDVMRRLVQAAKQQNMFKAKHIVGEYFIAINRRFVLFVIHAERMGLFRGIGRNRSDVEMHLHRVKREVEDQAQKAKKAIKFILENFNEFRINDGLLDEPFVRFGVQTIKVFIRAFKQGAKLGKVTVQYYVDMISDIVRLALVEKKHEAAIQRAGAGMLAGARRDCKTLVAIHRWYVRRKCYERPMYDEAEAKESSKPEEKLDEA